MTATEENENSRALTAANSLIGKALNRCVTLTAALEKAQEAGTRLWNELVEAKALLRARNLAVTDHQQAIFMAVLSEISAANAKHGENLHLKDGTGSAGQKKQAEYARAMCDKGMDKEKHTWRHILTEEACEALAESDPAKLRAELLQVAATAIRWCAAIDRREAETELAVTRVAP